MKKLLIVLIVALLPAMAFADLQLGAVGMYKGDVTAVGTHPVSINDFTFGGEARLKLGILQGGLTALYYPTSAYTQIVAVTDIGVSLDVLMLRFGAGIGPNFAFTVAGTTSQPANVGLNLKLSGDVNLGGLSVGLVGFYYLDSFSNLSKIGDVFGKLPWLGVSAMIKLF
jgi:hypothetical protein